MNVYFVIVDRGFVGWKKVCEVDVEYDDISMFDVEMNESKWVGVGEVSNVVFSEKEIDFKEMFVKEWEGNWVVELNEECRVCSK